MDANLCPIVPHVHDRMGGNALGQQQARLSRDRYFDVVAVLKNSLAVYFAVVEIPTCLDTKTSFGDVDFLVADPLKPFDPIKDVGSRVSHKNGNVLSFEYEGHQIDLITVASHKMQLAQFYYSYGDLGMIIGMMCRVIGLKFGFKGLSLVHESQHIQLSEDLTRILDFLDLDRASYYEGFRDEEDVYRLVMASKHFRPSMFSRHHDCMKTAELKRREMFRRFVERCQALPNTGDRVDTHNVQRDALVYFDKTAEFDSMVDQQKKLALLKQKFNGSIVAEITGLVGADLGRFMASFRNRYTIDMLADLDPDSVKCVVKRHWADETRIETKRT